MNDTLKVAMGAELGAAKAENEKLRGLLTTAWRLRPDQHYHEDHLQAEQKAWEVETAEVLNAADALSQQPEPTDAFTAVDMATAAAQGFRDGQAAVEQAPVQDEREAFEAWRLEKFCGGAERLKKCSNAPEVYYYAAEQEAWKTWRQAWRASLAAPIAQTTLSAVTAERDSLLQFKAAHLEWHEKTEWVQETAQVHELGKHRADVLKDRIDQLRAEVDRLRNELAGKPLVC